MDFSDVTLVTGEDQHIEAHRTILSACSPFFKAMLSKNRHSHPMIYMRGLKAKDLEAAIDFMYTGEANIFQDDLDCFLNLAEELKLNGLTGVKDEDDIVDSVDAIATSVKSEIVSKKNKSPAKSIDTVEKVSWKHELSKIRKSIHTISQDTSVVEFSKDMVPFEKNEDVESRINSMMKKNKELKWTCTVCGKIVRDKTNLYQHIEANHMEGVSHHCNHCGKISRSKDSLRHHVSAQHKLI